MRTKDEEKFRRIIEVIQRHSAEFGNSPTIREIVAETGISRGTVQRYLAELKEQGRLDYSGHRNIRMAGQRDAMEAYDKTPYVGGVRGDDITAWFNRHPGDCSYVILDDDDDMDGHMDHLVRTDFDSGLTEEKADECIRRLRGQ